MLKTAGVKNYCTTTTHPPLRAIMKKVKNKIDITNRLTNEKPWPFFSICHPFCFVCCPFPFLNHQVIQLDRPVHFQSICRRHTINSVKVLNNGIKTWDNYVSKVTHTHTHTVHSCSSCERWKVVFIAHTTAKQLAITLLHMFWSSIGLIFNAKLELQG